MPAGRWEADVWPALGGAAVVPAGLGCPQALGETCPSIWGLDRKHKAHTW